MTYNDPDHDDGNFTVIENDAGFEPVDPHSFPQEAPSSRPPAPAHPAPAYQRSRYGKFRSGGSARRDEGPTKSESDTKPRFVRKKDKRLEILGELDETQTKRAVDLILSGKLDLIEKIEKDELIKALELKRDTETRKARRRAILLGIFGFITWMIDRAVTIAVAMLGSLIAVNYLGADMSAWQTLHALTVPAS